MKVSIIVPVYNAEKYLNKCLDSLINQTYEDIEIIAINDGSVDNSGKILEEYARKDKRVIVINKQNGGVGSARNEGLKIFSGDAVAFVDSDDYVETNFVEVMLGYMQRENADIVQCAYFVNDELVKGENASYRFDENYNFFSARHRTIIWASLYHKRLLTRGKEHLLLFDEDLIMGEDCLFNARAVLGANKIVSISRGLYHNRLTCDSLSRSDGFVNEYTKIKAQELIIKKVEDSGFVKPLISAKRQYYFYVKDMFENMSKDRKKYKEQLKSLQKKVRRNLGDIRKLHFGIKVHLRFLHIAYKMI